MSELVTKTAADYIGNLVPPRDPELVVMEQYARETRFPIIGPAAGQYCYQIARIMKARRIFEMGSGYGYSTAWFARAVIENGGGCVHHVVWKRWLSNRARRHLARMGLDSVVVFHVDEAIRALSAMDETYDLILCDINKEQYPDALPVIKDKLRPGGVLLADNAWWFGGVIDEEDHSPPTEGMRAFTHALVNDPEWVVTFVPLRDGVLTAYRSEGVAAAEGRRELAV